MTVATADGTELFNSDEYRVPFPDADGHEVTEIVVRIGGALKLDRNNPEHTQFVEALQLGKYVRLTVTASVGAKAQTIRAAKEDEEIVSHHVRLDVQAIDTETV